MRSAIPFFLGLLLGACSTVNVPAPSPIRPSSHVEAVADLVDKTVAIVSQDPDDGSVSAECAGVWVAPSMILTADHCVSDLELGEAVMFTTHTDAFGPSTAIRPVFPLRAAIVFAHDADHDLAVVRAVGAFPAHTTAELRRDGALVGESVRTMGHPLGHWYSFSAGHVASVRTQPASGITATWTQTTAPISAGNSGGGLFDEDNRLVGIASRSAARGQNINLFVHASHVAAFLGALGIQ